MDAMGAVIAVSAALVIAGMLLMIVDAIKNSGGREKEGGEKEEGETKVGGVILIGPIPIIIGNDKSMIKWAIILTIIAIISFIVLAAVIRA